MRLLRIISKKLEVQQKKSVWYSTQKVTLENLYFVIVKILL